MNTRELRLGNILFGKDSAYEQKAFFRVEGIEAYQDWNPSINAWRLEGFRVVYAEDYEPVLLSEDILKKCGFTLTKDENIAGELYELEISLLVNSANDCRFVCIISNEVVAAYMVNYAWASKSFSYVHELQNLYQSLTGQELQINL